MSNLTPREVFYKMRNTALNLDPHDIGVRPSKELKKVYGVLMEIGHPEGTVTLITLSDGAVSLYYEIGGGIIGAGHHAEVRQAANRFLVTCERFMDDFETATVGILPDQGHVIFYVLTYKEGILTADASEQALGEQKHKLSEVFLNGVSVISELQKIDEFNKTPEE